MNENSNGGISLSSFGLGHHHTESSLGREQTMGGTGSPQACLQLRLSFFVAALICMYKYDVGCMARMYVLYICVCIISLYTMHVSYAHVSVHT